MKLVKESKVKVEDYSKVNNKVLNIVASNCSNERDLECGKNARSNPPKC